MSAGTLLVKQMMLTRLNLIYSGFSMLTESAYFSVHLVLSHLGLAYVLLVETNPFPELVDIFSGFRTSIGIFSIMLPLNFLRI